MQKKSQAYDAEILIYSVRAESPVGRRTPRRTVMAKVRVKIKSAPGRSGTKIAEAKVNVAPVRTDQAKRLRPIYQTRAQLMIHIHSGERPQTFRPR